MNKTQKEEIIRRLEEINKGFDKIGFKLKEMDKDCDKIKSNLLKLLRYT